jgi:hypothetical protein
MYKQMSSVLNNKWTIPVAVGVTSFTLGAAGGYFFGRKRSGQEVEEDTPVPEWDNQLAFNFDDDELATVTYIRERRSGDIITSDHPSLHEPTEHSFMDDMEAVDEFSEFELDWDAELSVEEDELEDAEEINNIFAGSDEEWDYEAEINRRGSDPYIIHVDEFVANELGYDQHTMTYYMLDDILADENDVPVYNYSHAVGELKFGHGSKDPSLVYIRSENARTEWEIIRHTGSFETEVRGLEIESQYESRELRHARSPQRFRMD